MKLVADDVLLQVTSSSMLQEILDAASWWSGRKDLTCIIAKVSYLQTITEQIETFNLDGERRKGAGSEHYLRRILKAAVIKAPRFFQRVGSAGPRFLA